MITQFYKFTDKQFFPETTSNEIKAQSGVRGLFIVHIRKKFISGKLQGLQNIGHAVLRKFRCSFVRHLQKQEKRVQYGPLRFFMIHMSYNLVPERILTHFRR